MNEFEITIGRQTVKLTMEDIVNIEAAVLAASKKPGEKVFRGHVTASMAMHAAGSGVAQHFSNTGPEGYILADC
ncbi:hypothetical protein AvCA_17000 [Azotobacter vinelandii CA]|uniref:Uncharacterized protein n=2 Tax=Azotobacter vinelandii TaxID=354 RepID=C1DSF9_AZOVD|nr:hypothetical protein [Azotobacter vinelandii]ACO77914.1 hypothetical protein Avin_17000 [Azotobacter vinelandii DJ]AGK16936.1 hypothetical protein AvCA_17000 [Azotobacter vinelandii CA]AGK20078.1 hypothetical protein AvCA6_17000 [Azotobacter vinelandii CA6]WKN23653.1 hypothetical protein AVAEIV_001755 [Azotobacter vinelandii]SFX99285.1 hypothetical protein SAMN04244547_03527 [Azotobacter vinelandii]